MATKMMRFGATPNIVLDAVASAFALKTLYIPIQGVATSRYQTFFDTKTGAGYQVTAGKIFYSIVLNVQHTGAGNLFGVGYGDTSVTNSVSAPTSAILITEMMVALAANAGVVNAMPYQIQVPASKYPYAIWPGGSPVSSLVQLIGFEE